jgi:O-antigen ligase
MPASVSNAEQKERMSASVKKGEFAQAAGVMAIGAYLMFSPVWHPSIAPRMYDNARILEIVLLVTLGLLCLFKSVSAGIVRAWLNLSVPVRWAVVLLLAGGAASAAGSDAAQIGVLQTGLVALLVVLFLLVCALGRDLKETAESAMAGAIAAGAFLLAFEFWAAFIQSLYLGKQFSWVSPFLDFANVRFFGQYQAYTLLLITLPPAVAAMSRSWRIIVYLVAANFWALQWMVGSRAVWIGFIAAMAIVSIFMRNGRLRWLGEQGALALAGGLIYLIFSTFILSTPNATPIPAANSMTARGAESASERITLAKAAIRLIAEHPLLGVGPGQFGLHFSETPAAHPHNTPLQLLSEYGLIAGGAGIALGTILVVFAARELRRRTSHHADRVAAGLTAALTMGLVDSLFSGNLTMPHSQVLLCVIAGWMVGRSHPGVEIPVYAAGRYRLLSAGFVGVTLLATVSTLVLTIEYLDVIREMAYPPTLRNPNLWQYGRFSAW